MKQREKIMLGVAGLAVAIGLVLQLGGPSKGPAPGKPGAPLDAAKAQSLTAAVAEATPSAFETALLMAVQAPWRLAAVYDKPLELKEPGERTSPLPRYTGYVELGSGRLAVLDGYEYQVGDTLEGGGYKVVAITPDKVTLESLATGSHEEAPYEGQDAVAR